MGDKHRNRNDTEQTETYSIRGCVLGCVCFFMGGRGFLTRRLRARCCTQSTDNLALVMRVCVQLLLSRGRTWHSSIKPSKNKLSTSDPRDQDSTPPGTRPHKETKRDNMIKTTDRPIVPSCAAAALLENEKKWDSRGD